MLQEKRKYKSVHSLGQGKLRNKSQIVVKQSGPFNLNHSSKLYILNLRHCRLRYRFYFYRIGKSGQHRAPHPANGGTSLKEERDSATENNFPPLLKLWRVKVKT